MSTIPEHLRPLHSNVLVRLDPPRERVGLIHIPDAARSEVGVGTIVAVGPGRVDPETGEREEMELRVGDRVAYETFRAVEKLEEDALREKTGETFELADEDAAVVRYTVIQQRHVIGVVEDETGDERIEVRA